MLDPFAPGLSVAEADRLHERLRAAGPVVEATDADGLRVWIITRYDDVARLLADPGIVNVRPGGPSGSPGLPLPPALARNLLNMVPDDHRRVRALAAPAFSRRRIGAVRQMVTARVDGLLDDLDPNETGVVDLFPAYASPLPADIIAEILGVTDADADEFRTAAATVMAMNPGEPTADDPRIPAMTTIVLVLMRVIAAKRKSPGDDVITDWITARDAEDRLTEEELISLAFLTFLAGFENSVYQIANAIGILAGLDRDQLLVEIADDQLWRARVTQLVLDAAPGSYAIRRFPVENITVGGIRIPAGSPLYLSLRAATNDPARGERPDLAFGRGPHYCLGADLAVMQLDIATRRLFQRHPGLSLVKPWETLDRRHTWRTHGPTETPVNLT
ncbi:cytochrome P450 [Rhodococcus sp. NPDC059968]|uniref:cytochrome P450 n=1 Tax=Rhodococcus sp. NPDC059968 TaxID=3347017 RepID=UPI00366F16B9